MSAIEPRPAATWSTYPSNNLLNPLLVAFHLQERLDLTDGQVLPIAECHQLVEGADELVCIPKDLPFVEAFACAGNHLGEQMQRVDVLENVGLLIGDEHHVQFVQGLVNESDIVLFDCRVLCARVGGLGERCEEGFDARPLDVVECAGEDGLAAPGADRRSEYDLFCKFY